MIIARAGSGWQTILADLSLILFMVTAAALSTAKDKLAHATTPAAQSVAKAAETPLSPQGTPLALYRADAGAPPLRDWLRGQAADARQQLTIVAQYAPGGQARALEQATALAREAGEAGAAARIVIEPGSAGTTATLAFDTPAASLARKLPEGSREPTSPKDTP